MDPAEHMGLVYNIARNFARKFDCPVEDLVQEGALGLIKAIEKFDPSRGTQLSSYAYWWIAAYINRYLQMKFPEVHVPLRSKAAMIPDRRYAVMVPLDSPRGSDHGETYNLYNEYPDPSPSPEDLAEASERREIVRREVRRCPMNSKARQVMRLRMEGLTYEAIGAEVGCSRQRVEQIINAVFVTLKPRLERALA